MPLSAQRLMKSTRGRAGEAMEAGAAGMGREVACFSPSHKSQECYADSARKDRALRGFSPSPHVRSWAASPNVIQSAAKNLWPPAGLQRPAIEEKQKSEILSCALNDRLFILNLQPMSPYELLR